MSGTFIDRLCDAVLHSREIDAASRALICRAVADTLAVAAAGFLEPVTRNALSAYPGSGATTWSGEPCESGEAAVMINAIAAHALDFDDVFLESTTHPSTVILPAVLSLAVDAEPDEIVAAFAAGLIAARAVAIRVGQGHYHRGWHGTATIGAFAAAAAAGRLRQLDERQLRSTFGLAGSLSAGLRINFGSQAKPCHAGFAAAAGVRAARLAAAGVDAADDVFAKGGFADLYSAGDGEAEPGDDAFALRADRLSVKLFPCCYASHRLIGAALDARRALGAVFSDPGIEVRLSVPAGSVEVLRYDRPQTALEAKFSGPFTVAVALLDGVPTLQHFTDNATRREDVRSLMARIAIEEDAAQPSGGDIAAGTVTLDVDGRDGATRASFERTAIPGSPEDPPAQADLAAKLNGCLSLFAERTGRTLPIVERCLGWQGVADWLGR